MPASPVIERIELTLFTVRMENLHSDRGGLGVFYAPGPGTDQVRLAVRVIADTGVVGEYIPPRTRAAVTMAACEALAHGLVGRPALEREARYRDLRRATKHIGELGIGPLDIALWDLAGKHHGASVSQLLDGWRTRLPAYASTLHGDREAAGLSSPEAYADFAERCLELGYRAYKMHGWKEGDPQTEIAMLRAVAERVGDRMTLMYDAGCNLATFHDAVRVGRVLDALGYFWFEDPYGDGGLSIHGHRQLKTLVKTPIMITEHVRNVETTTDVLAAGATDFARADPDYDGGITRCHKTAVAAEALGMDAEVHSCGPAMRHLMACLRNSNFYEVNLVHPDCRNPWSPPFYADDYSDDTDCVGADGCEPVPQGPGLGVTYDWNLVERNRVAHRAIRP